MPAGPESTVYVWSLSGLQATVPTLPIGTHTTTIESRLGDIITGLLCGEYLPSHLLLLTSVGSRLITMSFYLAEAIKTTVLVFQGL